LTPEIGGSKKNHKGVERNGKQNGGKQNYGANQVYLRLSQAAYRELLDSISRDENKTIGNEGGYPPCVKRRMCYASRQAA
jgi:hypothetical protein